MVKEMAPASEATLPRPGPKGVSPMDTTRILENAERDEARRTILREAVDRYNNELMDDEERLILLERIKRLRKALAL